MSNECLYQCPSCGNYQVYRRQKSYEKAIITGKKCAECKQLEWIENKRNSITINHRGCMMMDRWNQIFGLNFQHGNNGGEFVINRGNGRTYFVDGYEDYHGIIFEYDESRHEKEENKIADILREKNIFFYFNQINKHIRIIRYSEMYDLLYEVNQNEERLKIDESQIILPQPTSVDNNVYSYFDKININLGNIEEVFNSLLND